MTKPNLKSFKTLFESGADFSITEEQYLNEAGTTLPKMPYLEKKSALANMAKSFGYELKVKNVIIFCKKTSGGN